MEQGDQPRLESQQVLEIPESTAEFQEMIKTRREEVKVKTEEKRKEAVKFLEQRKLEQNVKFCGLPDEMWEEILHRIEDPIDLGSMWGVHPKFRYLSEESRINEYLLSQILAIKKLPYLWEHEITRMDMCRMFRTFSRGMKTVVDHCTEENLMDVLRDPESRSDCYCFPISFGSRARTLDRNLAHFREGPIEERAKLVFRRGIRVWLRPTQEEEREAFLEFREQMASLLEIIGDQIWCFALNTDVTSSWSTGDIYLLLQQWACLMPNLKWIDISSFTSDDTETISPEIVDNHPFPHLEYLQRIHFVGFSSPQVRQVIAQAVIRPNLHVKMLDVGGPYDDGGSLLADMKPVLSTLSLTTLRTTYSSTDHEVELLRPIFSANWNLKSLTHQFYGIESVKLVFPLLSNHIPTLEHVSFNLLDYRLPEFTSLRLPNLRHFQLIFSISEIDYSDMGKILFFTSLQFLLESKKLKKLCWYCSSDGSPRNGYNINQFREYLFQQDLNEAIKFKCGFQDLTYSNIWDVFPELAYAEIQVPDADGRNGKFREIRKPKLLMIE